MNPTDPEMSPDNLEIIEDVLNQIDDQLGEMLDTLAQRFNVRRSDVVKLAIADLMKRLKLEDDRKMLIAVPIDDVEFFESPLEALFRGPDQKYVEIYDMMRGRSRAHQ